MASSAADLRDRPFADSGDSLALAALALARRFAAGATLWCIAPEWRDHARHVAVEFVHPVIVGKPALAAVSVDGPDPVDAVRTLVRDGDVIVTIGRGEDRTIADIVRRAPAWGATTIWIGAGTRPPRGSADHHLWIDGDAAHAARDGRVVFQYHVLWELTHVCLEHPGLISAAADGCDGNQSTSCVTCSDEGRLGEVMAVVGATARVRTASGIEAVDTSLVGDVAADDLVLVHAGVAIAAIDTRLGSQATIR